MKIKRILLSSEHSGLAWGFNVSSSSCNNPIYYREYIIFSALSDAKSGHSRTHLFVDEDDNNKIAGYISLRASSLISESETGKLLVHPTLEIAELAVSKDYERKGIGTEMFNFAVLCAEDIRKNSIGIKYIAVCSDPKAVGFYEKLGFEPIESLFEIPRDGWNDNCKPMYIQLPEL